MLKLSTRSTYGVRAVFDLAQQDGSKPVRLASIAERQKIPRAYLQQIFVKLRRAGIIKAIRGPKGGFQLGGPAHDIRIGDVVRALEGETKPILCTIPENFDSGCHNVDECVGRIICQKLDGELNKILDSSTMEELCSEAERLKPSQGVAS
jgi:Rrf2 family protein